MTNTDFDVWFDSPGSEDLHLADTLAFQNLQRKTYDFGNDGSRILWTGPPDKSAIVLTGCQEVTFKDIVVAPVTDAVSFFDITSSPTSLPSSRCRFKNVRIEYLGTGKLRYGYRIDTSIGGDGDRNNERHQWFGCDVNCASEALWYFDGGQAMLQLLDHCGGMGQIPAKHCVLSLNTHTIRVVGGGGAGMTDYVYQFGRNGAGFGEIDGVTWEQCRGGLFNLPGTILTPVCVPIRTCRYNQKGIVNVPTIAVGPLVPYMEIVGNEFESDGDAAGKSSPCRISVRSGGGGAVVVRLNRFMQWVPAKPAIEIGTVVQNVDVFGNSYWVNQRYAGLVVAKLIP